MSPDNLEPRFWVLQLPGKLCAPRDRKAGWPPQPALGLYGAIRVSSQCHRPETHSWRRHGAKS